MVEIPNALLRQSLCWLVRVRKGCDCVIIQVVTANLQTSRSTTNYREYCKRILNLSGERIYFHTITRTHSINLKTKRLRECVLLGIWQSVVCCIDIERYIESPPVTDMVVVVVEFVVIVSMVVFHNRSLVLTVVCYRVVCKTTRRVFGDSQKYND